MRFRDALLDQLPNLVVAAVADVDDAVGIHEDSVRSIEATFARVAVRSIACLTITDQRVDATILVDDSDRVVFCIDQQQIAVTVKCRSLGSRQLSQPCVRSISRIARFPCARQMLQCVRLQIRSKNRVAFSQDDNQIAICINGQRAGTIQCCAGDRRAIGSRVFLARSGIR